MTGCKLSRKKYIEQAIQPLRQEYPSIGIVHKFSLLVLILLYNENPCNNLSLKLRKKIFFDQDFFFHHLQTNVIFQQNLSIFKSKTMTFVQIQTFPYRRRRDL